MRDLIEQKSTLKDRMVPQLVLILLVNLFEGMSYLIWSLQPPFSLSVFGKYLHDPGAMVRAANHLGLMDLD